MTDRTIWKFGLGEHELPADYQVVHAGQDPAGAVCVWISVPVTDLEDIVEASAAPTVRIEVRVLGTGHWFSSEWRHVGTYIENSFVSHILIREIPNTEETA